MNARARLLGVALLIGLVAGCGGAPPEPTDVTSDVDRQRAAILSEDPVLKLAVGPPHVHPGGNHRQRYPDADIDEVPVQVALRVTSLVGEPLPGGRPHEHRADQREQQGGAREPDVHTAPHPARPQHSRRNQRERLGRIAGDDRHRGITGLVSGLDSGSAGGWPTPSSPS